MKIKRLDLIDFNEQLSNRLSALNVLVCLCHVLERVHLMNGEFELLGLYEIEELGCVLFKISSLGDVTVDYGAHQADTLGCKSEEAHRVHGAGLYCC